MSRKKYANSYDGVLNVFKEKGYTSHDVVAIISKMTGSKAGHTGTLDPAAEGVLPVCLGKATRLSSYFTEKRKEYIGELVFGITTDTQDMTGSTIKTGDFSAYSSGETEAAVMSFRGGISQIPPMYSAIKIDGRKLVDLARQNIEIERQPRLLTIHELEIMATFGNVYEVRVICDKGTYIRSLFHDIGEKLGCGACMGRLLRTKSGDFRVERGWKLHEIKRFADAGEIGKILIKPEDALPFKRVLAADALTDRDAVDKYLRNGNPLYKGNFRGGFAEAERLMMFDINGGLRGIYEEAGEFLRPLIVWSE